MEVPRSDPRAQEKADRRTELSKVMEQAVQFFRLQLQTSAGAEARAYLARRGLDAGALERWEIGFAPSGWEALREALVAKGVPVEMLLACGLVRSSDKGRAPYDVFRNRIMFPIRDARGRAIAFGGRAMDPEDNAKYLNSPETELFDKSRNLYNFKPAREAAGKGQTLVVAEGYMDVIALAEAGFAASVAPLGTAVTDSQLQLMWRISDEPVIALDGDKAGLRAAYRVIDLALPLLEAGKSLRFALMPEGKDPDDLLRAEGAGAVSRVLEAAMPMVQLLWRRETEGRVFDSPERRAALDRRLGEKTALIKDPVLKGHYQQALKDLRWQMFRAARAPMGKRKPWNAPEAPRESTRRSPLVAADGAAQQHMRHSVILVSLLRHPDLIPEFEQKLEDLICNDSGLEQLRQVLLREDPENVAQAAEEALGGHALETLVTARHLSVVPCLRKTGDVVLTRLTVAEEFAKLEADHGWQAELTEAEQDLETLGHEALTWRLAEAARAKAQAGRPDEDTGGDFDVGPNGALIDRDERDALESLLSKISFDKKKRS